MRAGEVAPGTTQELGPELERLLGRRVEAIRRRRHPYGTSFPLVELDVRLADGTRLELLFKDVGAQSSKPALVREPRREIQVYREILPGRGLGTARCFGAVADGGAGRFWLFLERVHGEALWQLGELARWEAAARALAALHVGCRDSEGAHLLRRDAALCRAWLERALAFRPDPRVQCLVGSWEHAIDRLLALPTGFAHGELYPSNVIVAGERVCLVDFEMAGPAPLALDVAALVTGWDEHGRARIAEAYRRELPAAGRPSRRELDEATELCRLHLAVQWLGWSERWSPPAEHARDWAGEAVAAARRLGLV